MSSLGSRWKRGKERGTNNVFGRHLGVGDVGNNKGMVANMFFKETQLGVGRDNPAPIQKGFETIIGLFSWVRGRVWGVSTVGGV